MSNIDDYWDSPKPHSVKKSEIVSEYFITWAQIIGRKCNELHYLDLFSGRGEYKDGHPSTPLYIMDKISEYPMLASKMTFTFCEENSDLRSVLTECVMKHPSSKLLTREPQFLSDKISPSYAQCLMGTMREGTFTFIDPYGYCDISLELLDVVTSEWGCDSLSYISISGLVRNIRQPEKRRNLELFFGQDEFGELLEEIGSTSNHANCEDVVFQKITQVLEEKKKYHPLKYQVQFDIKKRASHYLLFLSKDPKGFEKMLDVMSRHGVPDEHGIPDLIFSPKLSAERLQPSLQLVTRGTNLHSISQKVANDYSGSTVTIDKLLTDYYEACYEYRRSDIRKAIKFLIAEGVAEYVGNPSEQAKSRLFGTIEVYFRPGWRPN